jgi:hypothetical protein
MSTAELQTADQCVGSLSSRVSPFGRSRVEPAKMQINALRKREVSGKAIERALGLTGKSLGSDALSVVAVPMDRRRLIAAMSSKLKVRRSTTALLATALQACVVAGNSPTIAGSLIFRTPIIVVLIATIAVQGVATRHRKARCVRRKPACLAERPSYFAGARTNHQGDGIPGRALGQSRRCGGYSPR